jgi:uncharacterized membrane protein SirB2
MNLYNSLKLVHVACVVFSILLFVYRYRQLVRYPGQPLAKLLRVLPHINDTMLLAAAVGMLAALGLNPLTTFWLLAKILALLLYIALGALCLKSVPGSRRQLVFFVLALTVFSYIVLVALTKQYAPG